MIFIDVLLWCQNKIIMTSIIVGLFPTQKDAKNLAEELENAGFLNEDYIVYINTHEDQKANFWERLFGERQPQFNTGVMDKLIASVAIKNETELLAVKRIFKGYKAVHTYEFTDVTIKEAESLAYLQTKVALAAKSEVYASQLRNRNGAQKQHSEITGEFSFNLC